MIRACAMPSCSDLCIRAVDYYDTGPTSLADRSPRSPVPDPAVNQTLFTSAMVDCGFAVICSPRRLEKEK
jgi:hypothetical protein